MADERWFVAVDGTQLEGTKSTDEVRDLIKASPSKKLVVWNEKMTGWADPATLPEFRAAAAPAPAPAPATPAAPAAEPPPRPRQAASAVASAVAASAPAARATVQHEVKFFRGLLDFGFEEFVTPKIIRTLYIVTLVVIALGFLVMLVGGIGMIVAGARYSGASLVIGLLYIVLSPLVALLEATFARVFFELVLLFFKMKESLVSLDEKTPPR
jgi:uncharacterized protein DUF4282